MTHIEIDIDKCSGCGLCCEVCGRRVIQMMDNCPDVVNPLICHRCGNCVAVCPEDAITPLGMDSSNFEYVEKESLKIDPDLFLRFIRSRRSIRNFKDKSIPPHLMAQVIDAGRYAPSVGNRQAAQITVVQKQEPIKQVIELTVGRIRSRIENEMKLLQETEDLGEKVSAQQYAYCKSHMLTVERIEKAWKEGEDKLFHGAPAVMAVHISNVGQNMREEASYTAMYMILMAQCLGLGTLLNGWFRDAACHVPQLKELLQIPPQNEVQVGFVMGYPRIRFRRLVDRDHMRVTRI